MNFIIFNGALLVSGFIAILIFSIGLMVLVSPLALFAKSNNPPKMIVFPLMWITGIYQIYFWGLWSAFCVAVALMYTQKPEVTWDWLYWVTGFMWCTSLIGWLAHKERQGSQSFDETQGIQKGTTFYSLIAVVAFIVFAFMPSFIALPYGWALKPLGLESYIVSKSLGNEQIEPNSRKSIEAFFEGYEHFTSANELAQTMRTSKDPLSDFEKVKTLMNKSKERLSECDIELLNEIHKGWGDIVSNKFVPTIDLLLSGIQPKGDRSDLARGDALMAELDEWLHNNWNKILLTLNEKYGFEIKK